MECGGAGVVEIDGRRWAVGGGQWAVGSGVATM